MKTPTKLRLNVASLAGLLLAERAPAQPMSAIDKNTVIATLHAEVAQIYECKPDTSKPVAQARALTWQFREPIATLMVAGRSVGRHYAGPSWDLVDGGAMKGKLVTSTPAPTANDIPWLELEVVDHCCKRTRAETFALLPVSSIIS
jgi:hypothetical protein